MSPHYRQPEDQDDQDHEFVFLRNPDTLFENAAAMQEPVSKSRRRSARECVADAWEATVAEDRLSFVFRALDYDPANLDALMFLLELYRYDEEEELEFLHALVEVSRRLVDPLIRRDPEIEFFATSQSPPGLRVRFRYGVLLQHAGRFRDAAEVYEEMLRLYHRDVAGVRYDYAVCLFVTGQLDLARTLLEAYGEENEGSPIHWLRVLERFLAEDMEEAAALFEIARNQNVYVEEYLTRNLRPPDEVLQDFDPSSMDEAVWLFDVLHHAWDAFPESIEWIIDMKKGG